MGSGRSDETLSRKALYGGLFLGLHATAGLFFLIKCIVLPYTSLHLTWTVSLFASLVAIQFLPNVHNPYERHGQRSFLTHLAYVSDHYAYIASSLFMASFFVMLFCIGSGFMLHQSFLMPLKMISSSVYPYLYTMLLSTLLLEPIYVMPMAILVLTFPVLQTSFWLSLLPGLLLVFMYFVECTKSLTNVLPAKDQSYANITSLLPVPTPMGWRFKMSNLENEVDDNVAKKLT
ncbi:MAG: hypothetical protein ACON5A_01670 [Candidatus Comchoanobacterales bacterium]